MNEAETAAGLPPTPGYRYAELVGDELIVAGQVPLDERGGLVAAGDVGRQAVQCFGNLAIVLEVHGFRDRGRPELDDICRRRLCGVGRSLARDSRLV